MSCTFLVPCPVSWFYAQSQTSVYITSVLGKERVFPTGCTVLSGISDINQGNFVYSNVTVDIYEMFIAALEKNIKCLGKLLKINT